MRRWQSFRSFYSQPVGWSFRRLLICLVVAFIVCIGFFHLLAKPAEIACPRVPLVPLDSRLVDELCSNDSSYCYSVVDYLASYGGSDVVLRGLVHSGRAPGFDTAVLLRVPEGETFYSSDTRRWHVDHWNADIVFPISISMVLGAFLMSSLSLDRNNYGGQALSIGLGGGSVNMALSSIKPEVNITVVEIDALVVRIAFKWFGVLQSNNHHVVVQDGLVFLKNAVMKGLKYDVVFLDACENGDLHCPAKAFHTLYAMKMLKKVLVRTGALVINMAAIKNENTECKEVKKLLVSTFKACVEIQWCATVNVVFVCTPSTVPNFNRLIPVLNNRLRQLERSLNIDHLGNGRRVVPPILNCSFSDFQLFGSR